MAGFKPAKPAKPAPIAIADGLYPVFATAAAGSGVEPKPVGDPPDPIPEDATDGPRTGERSLAANVEQRLRQCFLVCGSEVVGARP